MERIFLDQSWHKTVGRGVGTICTVVVSYTLECGIMINGEILNGEQGLSGYISALPVRTREGRCLTLQEVATTYVLLERVRILLPQYPDSPLAEGADNLNSRDVIRAFHLSDPLALLGAARYVADLSIELGRLPGMYGNLLRDGRRRSCGRCRRSAFDRALPPRALPQDLTFLLSF